MLTDKELCDLFIGPTYNHELVTLRLLNNISNELIIQAERNDERFTELITEMRNIKEECMILMGLR